MSVESTVLTQLMGNVDLVEEVTVEQSGSAPVTLEVLVHRDQSDPKIEDLDGRGRQLVHQARLKVFATDDPEHGGLVSPQVGDKWTLAKVAGGTAVEGWKAGPARGSRGVWTIPVELWEDLDAGGYDPNK